MVAFVLSKCGTSKQNDQVQAMKFEPETEEYFMLKLADFIQTLDPSKLCEPYRMYVQFSLDSIGKVTDSDFDVDFNEKEGCRIDSTYLKEINEAFEQQMPAWHLVKNGDTLRNVRLRFPVTFR